MHVYPIFLNDLHDRRCVVFGGGHEAERKMRELLECDATVVLISASPGFDVSAYDVEWIPREYKEGDLRNAFLAIVSETNPEKTRPIWEEAQRENILINAMDDVPHCSFVAGSVVRRGRLTLSISTAGAAPALSVRLRQQFERQFGPEFETFLEWMAALRAPMATYFPDFDSRRAKWYEVIDSDILELLASDRRDDALQCLRDIVGDPVAESVTATAPASEYES